MITIFLVKCIVRAKFEGAEDSTFAEPRSESVAVVDGDALDAISLFREHEARRLSKKTIAGLNATMGSIEVQSVEKLSWAEIHR